MKRPIQWPLSPEVNIKAPPPILSPKNEIPIERKWASVAKGEDGYLGNYLAAPSIEQNVPHSLLFFSARSIRKYANSALLIKREQGFRE